MQKKSLNFRKLPGNLKILRYLIKKFFYFLIYYLIKKIKSKQKNTETVKTIPALK